MIPSRAQGILIAIAVIFAGVGLVYGPQSCSLLARQPGEPVNLSALADDIDATRVSVLALLPKATPETRAKIEKLSSATLKVESALVAASNGGPIGDVTSAAAAALGIADQVIAELEASGKNTGDAAFWLGIARLGLSELSAGHTGAAQRAIDEAQAQAVDGPEDGPR